MRSTRLLALAALVALPFTGTAAGAAPASPDTGNAVSRIDTRAHVIDVRKGGGFKGGGMRGGFKGFGSSGGFKGFKGGGFKGFKGGGPRIGLKGGGFKGFRGRHWHKGHGHRRHFRPRFYGVPYYYYGPSYYYYDDYYYDDYDDGVVYADDAVARCEARYRSFDRATGTFLGNDGRRHLCPYLR